MTRIEKTPVTWDSQHRIYFKWENQQQTGSFKRRGALNKLLTLQDWELQRGLVTASAGNHGQVLRWQPVNAGPKRLYSRHWIHRR
jgi:threonine dehydratase